MIPCWSNNLREFSPAVSGMMSRDDIACAANHAMEPTALELTPRAAAHRGR